MTDHLEIEQKFDVDAGFERPSFDGLAGLSAAAPVLHHLSATYFDTADGRLAASKITLRRRTGGADEGWHLKLPADAGARREVHAPLDAAEREVPGELAERVAEVTGGRPLAPVARLDTERTVVTLAGPDGRARAEVADDVVTAWRLGPGEPGPEEPSGESGDPAQHGQERGTARLIRSRISRSGPQHRASGRTGGTGGRPPGRKLRWREVEVEVMAADPALQRAAAGLLLAAGARPAGHGSKLARVLESA